MKRGTKGSRIVHKRFFAVFYCLLLYLLVPIKVDAFKLPDTGQTKCYNTAGGEIPCAGTGQDGEYNISPLSYTDNGDGTVTDSNTGLMWQQQVDDIKRTWAEADAYCSSLTLGDYTDWQLPSKTKLISIVDYSIPAPGPVISPVFMPYAGHYFGYWTSTLWARYPSFAWVVYFTSGGVSPYLSHINDSGYVRCVRGGQYPAQILTDNGNGTVSDMRTGLMWQQGETVGMLWDSALAYCEGLSLSGHSDWRLPNNKEFESITDSKRWNPAIDTEFFPGTNPGGYWSSTTLAEYPNLAWVVGFENGDIDTAFNKDETEGVRCVRGGLPNMLHVEKSGTGSGTITSSPDGINCGTDCSEEYNLGRKVILTATPKPGSFFSGWGGDPDCEDGAIVSDGPKTCIASFSSALNLLTPVHGEFVNAGSPYDITWEVLNTAVTFKLFYSVDNKLTWVPITKSATGVYHRWITPAFIKNKKAYLKIVGFTADGLKAGSDISDAYFVIGAVNIVSPNGGGQPLMSGAPVDITWSTTPAPKAQVATYSVFYTTNGGLKWQSAGSGSGNPGVYPWTALVTEAKTKCKVKVVLKDELGNKLGSDVSDAFFTIDPAPAP